MLKDVISIEGVGHSFDAVNDAFAVITTEGNCTIYNSVDEKNCTNIDGVFTGLGVYSEREFYISEGFTSKIIDLNSLEITGASFKIDVIQGDRIISSEKEERKRYLISRLKNGSIEWKIPLKRGKHIYLDQKILVNSQYLDDGKINGYDLSDGSLIWVFDFVALGTWQDYDDREKQTQVNKILGIYDDKIYLYLNSGKILILDIKSGEKIAILKNDKHSKFDTFGNSIELDIKNRKLIQLANQDLIEVDLESLEVNQTAIEDMKSFGLENFSLIVFDSDFIFFTDKNHQTLGALNRVTYKIDWTHKLSQQGISESEQPRYGRDLKLKGDRLYVLDNKNTLHIFEN